MVNISLTMNISKIPFIKPFIAGAVVATRLVSSAPEVVAQPVEYRPVNPKSGFDLFPNKTLSPDEQACYRSLMTLKNSGRLTAAIPPNKKGTSYTYNFTSRDVNEANQSLPGFFKTLCVLNLGNNISSALLNNQKARLLFIPVTQEIVNRHAWNNITYLLAAFPSATLTDKQLDVFVGLPYEDFSNADWIKGGCNGEVSTVDDARYRTTTSWHELSHGLSYIKYLSKGYRGDNLFEQLEQEGRSFKRSNNIPDFFCPSNSLRKGERRFPDGEVKAVWDENNLRNLLGLPKRDSY